MIRMPISWRSPDATSRQNCLGLWRGGPELFQVVWFSRAPSKPPRSLFMSSAVMPSPKWLFLFSSEHAEAALADELEIIRNGKPLIDYEEKKTWRDREDTWVLTTKMPWRDAQGNIIGTFGVSHDITERKCAAELAAMPVVGKYAPVNLVRRLYR